MTNNDLTCWVPFGKDGRVLIRYVAREELRNIEKKATERFLFEGQVVTEVDEIKKNVLVGRAAVKGWEALTVKHEDFPYSPENCEMLMRRSYDFSDLVNIACVNVRAFIEKREEQGKKKSKSGSSGT